MSEEYTNYSGSPHPEDQWVTILTSQQLMKLLGYPDEVGCPIAKIFGHGMWHGRSCTSNDDIFELGYGNNLIGGISDHRERKFYTDELIESWLCEDYGIEVNDKHANKHKFISHNDVFDSNCYFMSFVYRLKKYVPLVKSSNKTN